MIDQTKLTVADLRYLKVIWHLAQHHEPITVTAVAARLEVAHPSASAAVKRLVERNLITRAGRQEVLLTEPGEREALRLVRRHRLLETYLAEALDVPWDEVHNEAERVEWFISDTLMDRIDHKLGFPRNDPHGDPIPPATGSHHEQIGTPLAQATPGMVATITRVDDGDPELLRYLAEEGLRIGTQLVVDRQEPFGGPLWVNSDRGSHALGAAAVRAVSVVAASTDPAE